MKLSEIKQYLSSVSHVNFQLPNETLIPQHFHVTEVGVITKNFIDCGGTIRSEKIVNFQLWYSNDVEHRLTPKNFLGIIALSEKLLFIEDLEVEVEYQSDTIGKYGLEFNDGNFILTVKQTDCLAPDKCIVPPVKKKVSLSELQNADQNCCTPGSKCC